MPNWCLNTVWFRGAPERMVQLRSVFEEMAAKWLTERKGQLPDFVDKENGYLFEINCGGDVFDYLTKWAPNPRVLMQIADHFDLAFSVTYDEPGNCVFGEYHYKDNVLTGIELDIGDFAKYDYDEETETYLFEGKRYDDSSDIKEIILQRKKEGL